MQGTVAGELWECRALVRGELAVWGTGRRWGRELLWRPRGSGECLPGFEREAWRPHTLHPPVLPPLLTCCSFCMKPHSISFHMASPHTWGTSQEMRAESGGAGLPSSRVPNLRSEIGPVELSG